MKHLLIIFTFVTLSFSNNYTFSNIIFDSNSSNHPKLNLSINGAADKKEKVGIIGNIGELIGSAGLISIGVGTSIMGYDTDECYNGYDYSDYNYTGPSYYDNYEDNKELIHGLYGGGLVCLAIGGTLILFDKIFIRPFLK